MNDGTAIVMFTLFFNMLKGRTYDGGQVIEFFFNAAGKLKSVKERSSITPPTILPEYGMVSEQTAKLDRLMGAHLFDNPKPVELIKDFARWFTSGEDIILDFFAGSGTTAQSVLELNAEDAASRRYVLVNIDEATQPNSEARRLGYETVSEITLARITKVHGDSPTSGFRAFRLSESAFGAPEVFDEDQLAFRSLSRTTNRSPFDCALEIVSCLGVTLDTRFTEVTEEEQSVLVAGNVAVAISNVPSMKLLDIAVASGAKVLAAFEDTFAGKDDLKANLYFACKKANITLRTF
jgi:adenine-specific DNA-methyltransferase